MGQSQGPHSGHRPASLALLPAAGAGVRARPLTDACSKASLEVGREALLARALRLVCDDLRITRVVVLLASGDRALERLASGWPRNYSGVTVTVVTIDDPTIGLARGILAARWHLTEPFVVVLPDEVYLRANHADLPCLAPGALALCGALPAQPGHAIARNYSLRVQDGRIVGLTEKPPRPEDGWLGCGTFVFAPEVLDVLARAAARAGAGPLELIDLLDNEARRGARIELFALTGEYVNVNTAADWQRANDLVFGQAPPAVSVVIPAFEEEDSIATVVAEFLPHVHEVLVVDNHSRDRTAERARAAGARVLRVQVGGYGAALRAGLDQAEGDVLVLVEADHTFRAADLPRLLGFLTDHELVLGTRTARSTIQSGAAMGPLLRLGNVCAGLLLGALWWRGRARLTDVGCTYRALRRPLWSLLRSKTTAEGPAFAPELTLEALRLGARVVEIPVSYWPRMAGTSKRSGSWLETWATARAMLALILRKRLRRAGGTQRA